MTDDPQTLRATCSQWEIAAVLGHKSVFTILGIGSIYRNEIIKLPSPFSTGLRAASESIGPELSQELPFKLHVLRSETATPPSHYGHAAFVDDEFHITVESFALFDEIFLRSRYGNALPKWIRFQVQSCAPQNDRPTCWTITGFTATVRHWVPYP